MINILYLHGSETSQFLKEPCLHSGDLVARKLEHLHGGVVGGERAEWQVVDQVVGDRAVTNILYLHESETSQFFKEPCLHGGDLVARKLEHLHGGAVGGERAEWQVDYKGVRDRAV